MALGSFLKNAATTISVGAKAHSPEIMIGLGVVGFVATVVLACKETVILGEILEESQDMKNDLIEDFLGEELEELAEEDQETMIRKTDEVLANPEYKKLEKQINFHTAKRIVWNYLPAFLTGVGSIALVLGGYGIIHSRYLKQIAAYETLQSGYNLYRSRIKEKYGENADEYGLYGIDKEQYTEKDPETGKKVAKERDIASERDFKPELASPYAKYLSDAKHAGFIGERSYDRARLECLEQDFIRQFESGQRIIAKDVYEAIGFDKDDLMDSDLYSVAGSWKGHDGGDDYFTFNIKEVPKFYYDLVGRRIDYIDYIINPNFAGRIIPPYSANQRYLPTNRSKDPLMIGA